MATPVLIVGAGLAGLCAAAELRQAGLEVLLIDKGRGVGGRMASRRIGPATFDHGAQFFTARNARFAQWIDAWTQAGIAAEWYRGDRGAHPRFRGSPSMTAVPKLLAGGLEVLLEHKATALAHTDDGWKVSLESGASIQAGAVLLTAPVPQSLALLDAGGVVLPADQRARLEQITYQRCITVMAVMETPAQVPHPGGFAPTDGPIAWIADNQAKGISAVPAVTIHATPEFSLEHWERDRQDSARELLQAAGHWLGGEPASIQVHGWRYARPVSVEDSGCMVLHHIPPLLIAGDAFMAPRVEGAVQSGWAAAQALLNLR